MRVPRVICRGVKLGSPVRLDDSEWHHLSRVVRASSGSEIEVLDGAGGRFRGVFRAATRSVEQLRAIDADVGVEPVVVVQGLLDPSRMDWLIEKLSELGVQEVIPLIAARSVGKPRLDRWRRIAEQSAKQSGRAMLMAIGEPITPVGAVAASSGATERWLLDPHGGRPVGGATATSIAIVVGPAGGFTPDERELFLDASFTAVRLARSTLRGETAAIAATSLIVSSRLWSEQDGCDSGL